LVFERNGVDRQKTIKMTTATSSTQLTLDLLAQNTAGLGGFARVELTSGDSTTQSRVITTAQADNLNSGFCDVGTSVVGDVNLYRFSSDGETNYYSGFRTITDLTGIPSAFMYNQVDAPSSTYTAVRILNNNITMFSGSALNTTTNIADFNVGNCSFYVPIVFASSSAGIQNRTDQTALSVSGASVALTINGNNLTFKGFSITTSGTTNTITSYAFTNIPFNCDYTIAVYNGGTGNLTFNQVTGTGYRFNGNANFVVPTTRYATIRIQKLAANSITTHFFTGTLF
jgi:hypothetical protein